MSGCDAAGSILECVPVEEGRAGTWPTVINYGFYATPLGRCMIGETNGRICYLAFAPPGSDEARSADLCRRWPGVSLNNHSGMTDELPGKMFSLKAPAEVSVSLLVRGTPFQLEVWQALRAIPAGEVRTYSEIAQSIGRPKATRAVGSAIGANPIAWLIPCHRVIRSDGQLGGYRWGTAMKTACLAYERRQLGGAE
ncbi:hypothetical protein DDZ13_04375 [Coraliomargarita sinensis]|uniref:methylated-DNA--[protein]-cysteine S-methyltransferase n=1 Tax=Coraliomargarita sinensis TaxID=2174842 RepID=A0A317ZLU7_9BACT|nr:methylated-DNA--[protein]-cysteine S-methyltransferase [Coraliomargarita sinensis]PXA05203.1 hypothetical protein DDZ13_04375 [Coraliomargarita sinensis]